MRSKKLHWLLGIAFIIILGLMYLRNQKALDKVRSENTEMSTRIKQSVLLQKDAIIQKHISEQLEEIAQQQKFITEDQKTIALEQRAIAEQKRQEALEQRAIAEQKQQEAIFQRQVADQAKTRAVDAFNDAERQRAIAIEQKNAAEAAEKNANRLRMLALGESLSARSINQKNTGNDTLASLFAIAAWHFTNDNKGDLYQTELFQALKMSSGEDNSFRAHKGPVRDLALMPQSTSGNLNLISVSQNGEIILWKGDASILKPSFLVNDHKYDLKCAAFNPNGSILAASYALGNVIILHAPFKNTEHFTTKLSDYKIDNLVFINDNTLVFNEKNNIIGVDVIDKGSMAQQIYSHSDNIENIWFDLNSGNLYFSDVKGRVCSISPRSSEQAQVFLQIPGKEISSLVIGEGGKLAVGTTSGNIYVKRNDDDLLELVGHVSQVNDIQFINDLLISISYDRTVRLWNLKTTSYESVVIEELDGWGYCLSAIPGTEKVISAGADKLIRITTLSHEKLAELVRKRLLRDFTKEEWNMYVDPTIEFRSFNQK